MPLQSIKALWRRMALPLLVMMGLAAWQFQDQDEARVGGDTGITAGAVEAAYAAQRSGVWVEIGGQVMRVLSDDNEGSRHQRFILKLASGHTVLVAHNIDLAERIPVSRNDPVSLRGRYEWNDRGGVVHWTHHDPQRRGAGGWIRYRNETYR